MASRRDDVPIYAVAGALSSTAALLTQLSDHYLIERTGVRDREGDRGKGEAWLGDCLGDPRQLYIETRLRPGTFWALAEWLEARKLVTDGGVSLREKLLIFLYICGQGASWRATKYRCGHSTETISRCFHEVLDALLHLCREIVKPPDEGIPEAISKDPKRMPFFKDCIGALDGSHFLIHVPATEQRRFRNRHGDLSQNVLAVVDFDLNFVYILPGWEGSAHDGRVLKDAQGKGLSAPRGRYYLADAGYSNSDMLLTPYRGTRYHLREFNQAGKRPETMEELFNLRHSSLRNVVERTFGVFKRRWRIFDRPHEFSVETQTKLVYALAAVHNLINRDRRVDDDFEELGMYDSERREMELRDRENEQNLAEVSLPMNSRRERIAKDMWESYCEALRITSTA